MTQYRRGADFERKTKKEWEANGWFVVRSAGSKGPVDLVAIQRGVGESDVVLIQCKISGRISPGKFIELSNLAKALYATAFIATKERPYPYA